MDSKSLDLESGHPHLRTGPAAPTSLHNTTSNTDTAMTYEIEKDPFAFNEGVLDETQLEGLRSRRKGKKGKKLESYHRRQNNLIEYLLKPMDEHTEEAKEAEERTALKVRIAVWASLLANLALCILQLYAAISSASLSLLATGIDSVFDIGSNILLFYLHRKARSLDTNKWPVGGSRLETIGNIIYGSLMGSVNLVVVVESMQSIVTHKNDDLKPFHIPSLVAVGAALGVKLILFLYCLALRGSSSQVHMLWEDHRNDLFINGFGLLMSAGGSKLAWFLDPMGAIIIAAGVIIAWCRTIYQQFELLAGKSAPHEFIQLLTYKAATFTTSPTSPANASPNASNNVAAIEKVDTVRAYHSGPEYFVEIDVVMAGDTPLSRAHDVAQQLQDKIEVLPGVGRAFVHVDHECTHKPEHRKMQ